MLAASLYITSCSVKNRIRVRLRRLREPKYFIGAIVGAAYFYFTIFARLWGRRVSTSGRARRTPPPNVPLEALRASGPAFVGVALLAMMVAAWTFPGGSSLLEFTEAEVQFLFSAPVSRRALLLHRLLRSQISMLFASIVPALMFPSASPGSRAKVALGMWIILVTGKVHFTGITLARTSLTLQGADARRRQWGALALMLGATGIVGVTIARAFLGRPPTGFGDVLDRFGLVATTGLSHVILWPFMALAWPLFAPWPGPYLKALAIAAGILALNVAWVFQSDAAFQEAAAQADAKRAAKALRKMPAPRHRATIWTLPLTGRPETLFVWKNVVQMLREANITALLRYGAPFLGLTMAMAATFLRHNQGLAALLGTLASGAAAMTILLGPQLARTDLRQDLLHLELLKTWPIRGSAVIRGEMLWPAALLTTIGWIAIGVATLFWTAAFPPATLPWRVSGAVAAALIAPGLISAQFLIHNAAAVVFPAWVPLGTSRPRGIDAMGQRLIMFAAVLIGLVLLMAPGAIAGGVIGFAFWRLTGPVVLIPAAAVCTAVVLIEVLAVTEALGPVYERLDVSGVERAE